MAEQDPLGEAQQKYRLQTIWISGACKYVDQTRLAYAEHSFNVTTGAFLAGIDPRFGEFVLMAGALSDRVEMKAQEFRKQVGAEEYDVFFTNYSWLDEGKYVAHAAPAKVFLQYAT